jgi:hypothetical protein
LESLFVTVSSENVNFEDLLDHAEDGVVVLESVVVLALLLKLLSSGYYELEIISDEVELISVREWLALDELESLLVEV